MDWLAKRLGAESPALSQLKARRLARAEWEAAAERLLDRYFDNGASVRDLKERLRTLYPNNAPAMLDNLLTLNLVRKVVDTKARLYRKPPRRTLIGESGQPLPGEHPAHAAAARLFGVTRLNAKLKWLNRLYELLNGAVLWGQVDWRTRRPTLTVLPAHHLIVEQNPADPASLEEAAAIYVPVGGAPDSPLAPAAPLGYVVYRYEEDGQGGRRVAAELLDADFAPRAAQPPELAAYAGLSRYPFVLARKGEPLQAELFPDVPHGLLHAADWLDHELTRGALNSRQTDFPAYAFNGTAEELGPLNPATGAGAILCLGDPARQLVPLAVNPREAERNGNLLVFLKMFAQMNDLTPSAFTFDVELLSGTAKFHDKQPEIEYREDLLDSFRLLEEEGVWPLLRDLARLARFEGAAHFAHLRLAVAFPEQVIPLARAEELSNLEREFRLGLKSPADVLAAELGVGRAEAQQVAERNRAEGKP